ncbi:MAG: heavy-metal-associated domain-containing protein [Pikeienuella sp.]|uniref:heavy-metal-associated domain-containing protein n=1 Tax=Pikeienuella sp. TaxID=2831957 RepID=UPI00391C85A6
MKFRIEAMHCGGCARGVTAAIRSVDPAAAVEADPPSRAVTVTTDRPRAAIVAALEAAGFPPAA